MPVLFLFNFDALLCIVVWIIFHFVVFTLLFLSGVLIDCVILSDDILAND